MRADQVRRYELRKNRFNYWNMCIVMVGSMALISVGLYFEWRYGLFEVVIPSILIFVIMAIHNTTKYFPIHNKQREDGL